MLQQLEYDADVGREVLERRDAHYVGGIFLVLVRSSTICQDQNRLGRLRLDAQSMGEFIIAIIVIVYSFINM